MNEQNAVALKLLKSDPDYQKDYDAILSILDADDRIPMGELHGESVFNFWQDPAHVRGIWRRTTIASYETPNPQWDILLDVDKLAADEGKSWVFKGASCSPDLSRCLISLSPGGGDTTVLREFDPAAKRFVEEGFALGEAKAEAAYVDANTILFGTDFGGGHADAIGLSAHRENVAARRETRGRENRVRRQDRGRDRVAGVIHSQNGSIASSRAGDLFRDGIFLS